MRARDDAGRDCERRSTIDANRRLTTTTTTVDRARSRMW
jgi:hypothetical protein